MVHRDWGTNPTVHTDDDRFSTFAVDVDTGSYRLTRAYLRRGELPPPAAVRTEEFINALDYQYPSPSRGDLSIQLEACPGPVRKDMLLLRVGIQARRVHPADRKPTNLTLVIDTSGSMEEGGKLKLVQRTSRALLDALDARDRVSVVRYNERARRVLCGVRASERESILHEIDRLHPEGRTSVQGGLELGYLLATETFDPDRTNHVILFSDGVANTDRTDAEGILRMVERHRTKRITLTTIGVGFGNYNDVLLEQLADKGDGSYHYIDSPDEGAEVLGKNFTQTTQIVAADVKVQVEFNPKVVRRYRLMGYENRDLADRDFRDGRTDGGEMGAGQSVTALYAFELQGDPRGGERIATARIRYKRPSRSREREISQSIHARDILPDFGSAGDSTRLAAVVACFAEWLRETYWARQSSLEDLIAEGRDIHVDPGRAEQIDELLDLIAAADRLSHHRAHRIPDHPDEEHWWRSD